MKGPHPIHPTAQASVIRLLLLLPCLLVPLTGCEDEGVTFVPERESISTFDSSLDGWGRTDVGLAAGSSFSVVPDAGSALFEIDVPEAGGEAVVTRGYTLTPEVDYIVLLQFNIDSTDGTGVVEPWEIVAGASVEDGDFAFTTARGTETALGNQPERLTLIGDVEVTAGPRENEDDTESEIRVAIGIRPLTAGARTYRLDNLVVRFVRADAVN